MNSLPSNCALVVIFSLTKCCLLGTVDGASSEELSNISLRLYLGKSFDDRYVDVLVGDAVNLLEYFDFEKPTVLYIHGYNENLDRESVHTVVGAYLKRQDHNVLAANYGEIAAQNYLVGASSASGVGKAIAKALDDMVAKSLSSKTLHIVGHSLGGQIAGYVGRNVGFKVPRITGLDPAGPGFYAIIEHLTHADAEYVDVIHTDFGVYGIALRSGGADFYPNDGARIQPGCPHRFWPLDSNDFCSHYRSWIYYAESVVNEKAFIGVECDDYSKFRSKKCRDNNLVPMGFAAPIGTKGTFYLETNDQSPYGRGQYSVNPISRPNSGR